MVGRGRKRNKMVDIIPNVSITVNENGSKALL